MQQVKQGFNDRIAEIDLYYNLLENIISKEAQLIYPNENDRREVINVTISATLKSSAVLQLYNLVESTVSNCLVVIHASFSDDAVHYTDLSDDIQKLWVKFHYDYFKKTSNEKDILHNLKIMIDTWVTNSIPITLTYKEFTKHNQGSDFSGNLDSKKIAEIAEKYGIHFDEKCKEIQSIKNMRNKLAHGEVSFEEQGRSYTMEYMTTLKDRTVDYLNLFILAVENYITQTKYRR